MRQNLGQLIDGVLVRLGNRHEIKETAVTEEINHSLEELHSRIRDQRGDWLIGECTLDITVDINIIELPEDVGDLKMVERSDVEGAFSICQRMSMREVEDWDLIHSINVQATQAYGTLADRKLLLQPKPTISKADALRLTYSRRMIPLRSLEDVPDVPDELHEWLIVGAMDRMRQYADVVVAQAQMFDMFKQEQNQRLIRYLAPQHIDQPTQIGDEDAEYLNF